MSEKLLTIAIPTYNGEKTISNMLDILLPQCLKYIDKIEVFISDNASTDDTANIINDYCKKYPFLSYVRNNKNIGPDSNFLQCMQIAKGKYTLLLSDDDILMEDKLDIILDFLENNDLSLVYLNAKGFHEKYIDEQHTIYYQRAIYDNRCFTTNDKIEFMKYAGRMWGFLSCFICLTEAFRKIESLEKYKGTNWLQSYIHILCSCYEGKKLGVISIPCIGAGIYSIVSNFDSSRVDGDTYRKMLDFAVMHGFDKKQLDRLFIWRVCFISKRSVIKERASGITKTDVHNLFRLTRKYPYAWINLYPFLIMPKWICKSIVRANEHRKYSESLHVNRDGDVIG